MTLGAETLIPTLTKALGSALLKAAGRQLRRRLQEPERRQALERVDRDAVRRRASSATTPGPAWQLAEALCFRAPEAEDREPADAYGAHLAGLLLPESADLERVAGQHLPKLERVRSWQRDLLRGTQLAAPDRAACGRSLARLGETREEVLRIEAMELCRVPPGPFEMGGEETEPEQVDVAGFWLGRYPVTRAQYGAFVDAGGYGDARWWSEARSAGVWKGGALTLDGETIRGPRELREVFSLANHPVVGVSWYEACAFCRWMTERLREQDLLARDWEARLPREAEWEKAARGGLEVPAAPAIRSPGRRLDGEAEPALASNEPPRRRYPWGDEIDGERANYGETTIGSTSAVGCFPSGSSPYGCEDMSGNVWEWCADSVEISWSKESARVLRGGAWLNSAVLLRAAVRGGRPASLRGDGLGFRVLAAPASLGS